MKFLILTLLTAQICFAQPKKINVTTTIQQVTVYTTGATIERTGTIPVTSGRSEIVFAGLSNQLEQQSMQLRANANITLLAVQTTRDFFSERKLEWEEKAFIERSMLLTDDIERDTKLLEVFKQEEAMLIKNQAIGGQAGVKAADLKEALDLHRQRLSEIFLKQALLKKQISQQQNELSKIKAQAFEISKKRDSINYVVTALIESKESRNITFQLTYTIKDAGWFPAYDVRVPTVAAPLQITMNANVFQRSGETWKDVALLLSTGNPSDNATPSELQPWRLGYHNPSLAWVKSGAGQYGSISGRVTDEQGEPVSFATIAIKGSNQAVTSDDNGFFRLQNANSGAVLIVSAVGYSSKEVAAKGGYFSIVLSRELALLQEVVVTGYSNLEGRVAGVSAQNKKQRKDEVQTVGVETQYQPTTTVYKIDEKYTLQTDGKTTTIGIRQIEVPALYDYYAAPKIDPAAFLSAKITAWQEFELLSGEANLYFEGTYLGKTYVDLTKPDDTLSLSLGKDNSIKIGRKLIKEYSTKRFIGSNRTESKQYETSVRNTKKVPVTIEIKDQYPVSVVKEITVEDVKAPDAQVDKETGIVTWQITLQPGEEKKLSLGYSVKYPKDRRVVVE